MRVEIQLVTVSAGLGSDPVNQKGVSVLCSRFLNAGGQDSAVGSLQGETL